MKKEYGKMTDLIPIESVSAVVLFVEGGLDELLEQIRDEATDFEANLDTVTGRKEIASQARKVASSKIVIDDARKALVAGWKTKAKAVDAEGKRARDYLDSLKAEIRQPLTEWEGAEAAREKIEREAALIELCHEDAISMDDLFTREAEVKAKEDELARLKAAEIEREREKQRDIDAKYHAEQAAADRIIEADRAEARAKKEVENLEDRKSDIERAERERVERDTKRKADIAAREEQRRIGDLAHQKKVNRGAYDVLNKALSEDLALWKKKKPNAWYGPEDVARKVIVLIAQGKIPGARMVY
jgi:colicin import membrane protein